MLASIAFPAWLLGQDPSLGIVCASYGQDLADALARDCRTVMASDWYRAVFPTRLARNALHDFATGQKGYRLATSVGGVLTGRGADVVIIDDPLKPDEALSDQRRNSVNAWFDNSLLSRLNSQATGRIVVVMQRLHLHDLVGHLLEKGGWSVLSLPAIAEEDERIAFDTLLGPRVFTRKAGEPLHPARFSRDALEEVRRAVGPYNFASQYQQSPVPLEGNLVKRSWLARCTPEEAPGPFTTIVQSWDTANEAGELNDYSVCTTWGIRRDRHCLLLDVFRRRLEFPDLKRAVRDLAARFRPGTVLIEDRASGTQLIQELRREGLRSIRGVEPRDLGQDQRRHGQSLSQRPRAAAPIPEGLRPARQQCRARPHGRWRSNVWTCPGASSIGSDARAGLRSHPTVKPVALLADALLDLSRRGEIVLDPFLGSGSTLIAADKAGRVCRRVEHDPLYLDLVVRRYQEETRAEAILAGSGQTFAALAHSRTADHGPRT